MPIGSRSSRTSERWRSPGAIVAEHIVVDDDILEAERHLYFELERHGLVEPLAITKRQVERALRHQIAWQRRQHSGPLELMALQEAAHLIGEAATIRRDRVAVEAGDAIIAERGLDDRGLHFVRIELER